MTNRRNILSTLCTGSLALLAPVVARAKPRRWVGFHSRGVKPMVITPREDLTPDQLAEFKRLWEHDTRKALLHRAEIAEAQFKSADCRAKYHRQMATAWRADAERHPNIALADRCRDACFENASLRALLAEARDLIANTHQEHVPGCVDCKPLRAMGDRIDNALK